MDVANSINVVNSFADIILFLVNTIRNRFTQNTLTLFIYCQAHAVVRDRIFGQ